MVALDETEVYHSQNVRLENTIFMNSNFGLGQFFPGNFEIGDHLMLCLHKTCGLTISGKLHDNRILGITWK